MQYNKSRKSFDRIVVLDRARRLGFFNFVCIRGRCWPAISSLDIFECNFHYTKITTGLKMHLPWMLARCASCGFADLCSWWRCAHSFSITCVHFCCSHRRSVDMSKRRLRACASVQIETRCSASTCDSEQCTPDASVREKEHARVRGFTMVSGERKSKITVDKTWLIASGIINHTHDAPDASEECETLGVGYAVPANHLWSRWYGIKAQFCVPSLFGL